MFGNLTYLILVSLWAVPVLALQWAVGFRRLWAFRQVLTVSIVIPTAYLTVADGIAIGSGIWVLHAGRILGVRVLDVPLEEMLFFLVTNAMVAQTVILLRAPSEE